MMTRGMGWWCAGIYSGAAHRVDILSLGDGVEAFLFNKSADWRFFASFGYKIQFL